MQQSVDHVSGLKVLPPILFATLCKVALQCFTWDLKVVLVQHAVVVKDLSASQQEVLVVVSGSQLSKHQVNESLEHSSAHFQVLV